MTNTDLMKMVKEMEAKLYNSQTVKALTNEKVSDFERGKVRGKIEAFTNIILEMEKIKKANR